VDYKSLYEFRFKDVDQAKRVAVWKVLAPFIVSKSNGFERTLDPACGLGEFINSCGAEERWACDLGIDSSDLNENITFFNKSFFDAELPSNYFDLIFLSNVLEHMNSQQEVNEFLKLAFEKLKENGTVIIMGPNFRYCFKEYFDFADHIVPLTHIAIQEHLIAAKFHIKSVFPKFIPYSFKSKLPANPVITRVYLRLPILWKFFGKQFLVIATKTTSALA
jgi:hypothetical protein